ncbi:MAG: PAS domain S-box protein, partial [Rhodoferax sp.]|nr:PAS domain S-box protein [Rhodoferax sp.]
QEHLNGRTPIKQCEVRLRTKQGSYRWFLDRGKVVARDASGTPLRMVGTITDISDRHAIQDALVESESKFRGIIDASPVPMALNDGDHRFSFVNPAFLQTFGYSLDEVPTIDAWWHSSYPDPDRRAKTRLAWQGELARASNSGTAFTPMELLVRCRDGANKAVLATASAFKLAHRTEVLVVLYDITALKHAQAELSNSVLEKEALLKEVHHRVKNNLQVITSLLRLESMRRDSIDTRAVLSDMQGRIRSMALLHESLYRTGMFASVDLGDYLGRLVTQAFQSQIGGGEALQLRLDLHSVRVAMDQATPCGLLVNELVSNCIKHGFPDGRAGEVRVQLHVLPSDHHQVRLRVSDTGVGLPADFASRRRQSLGLQLVEDLARQIGGQLEIGDGALFSVTFRTEDVPAASGTPVQNTRTIHHTSHG